jgi:UDP-N-acetylmuramoylalanine--D-glutamate ligase
VEAYVQAKANLLRWQGADDIAVLNEENETSRELIQQAKGKVIVYGTTGRKPFELKIPGQHNQLNAQAALAAANVYGISWQEAQDAIRDFPGLPHRLELVHERHGVRFYNDSIATIPEAAIAAMDAFGPRTVIQIVGGHDKKLPLTALCNALVERAKAVLCIGETGPRIAEMIANSAQTGAAPVYDCGDLATAMTIAKRIAVAGDVVLLSTGSSSYDQFTNFEERGQRFAQLARDAG